MKKPSKSRRNATEKPSVIPRETPDTEEEQEFDLMTEIETELLEAGLDTNADKTFTLEKKVGNMGTFAFIETFDYMPELSDIGSKFGGGRYRVAVKVDGKYFKTKKFAISSERYPEKSIPEEDDTQSEIEELRRQRQELMFEQRQQAEAKKPDEASTTNMLLLEMIKEMKSGKSDYVEGMKFAMEMSKNNAPNIDPSKLAEMMMSSFRDGQKLMMSTMENHKEEGVGDILKDMLVNVAKNIDPTKVLSILTPRQLPMNTQTQPQVKAQPQTQEQPQVNADQLNMLFETFIAQLLIGYDNQVDFFYFSEQIKRIASFKSLADIIEGNETDIVIELLKQTPYKSYFEEEDFKDYMKEIIEGVKNFDTILAQREAVIDEDIEDIEAQRLEKMTQAEKEEAQRIEEKDREQKDIANGNAKN